MGTEGRFDGAEPAACLGSVEGVGEARSESGGDARRCRAAQLMAAEEGIAEADRLGRRNRFPLEPFEEGRGIAIGPLAALVAGEIDVAQVEQDRLPPALLVRLEIPSQRAFVDGLGADPGADDGLDPIDQAPPDHRIAALHPELDRAGVERLVGLLRLGVEEAHVLDEPLVDDGVDLGEPDGEGLLEPERVLDDLIFEGSCLVRCRRTPHLEGEGLDPLGDLAAQDLDGAGLGLAAEARLRGEDEPAEQQEMEERRSQQGGPFRLRSEGYRNAMERSASPPLSALARRNLALVDRYFERLGKGDPAIAELFAEDARWLAPQSAPVGRLHEGLEAVLALMASGIGLYDSTRPMDIERTACLAGDELVYVEMTIRATTGSGEPYENHYVMVFQLRDDRIVEVREYVDSLYAQRKLFDPVGMASPLDAKRG